MFHFLNTSNYLRLLTSHQTNPYIVKLSFDYFTVCLSRANEGHLSFFVGGFDLAKRAQYHEMVNEFQVFLCSFVNGIKAL